jgi:dolichyl-phosphate-mannose-protein mannosyltransferase
MQETGGMSVATATPAELEVRRPANSLARLAYSVALLVSLSIWFLALRAPLWLDETLAYWQVNGGLWKVWSRSQLMPSSIGYLYILWLAKSILGSREIALKIPSLVAMLGAVYLLFRSAREMFDEETAFIAAIFFSLETNVVFAATDARPYGFALLATNLAIFAFVRWMAGHEMRQAVLFGAAAAGILYFHYLFSAILPAFAIYYLVVRRRFIKQDARQLAAVMASFALLVLPLVLRVASLYQTKVTHVVQEMRHPGLTVLNTLAPVQTLVGFVLAAFLAGLVRKIKLPTRGRFPAILLAPLLALVPVGVLFGASAVTPAHLVIPRYLTVIAPGSALTWAWLTTFIDSRVLRQFFCVGLVTVTVFEAFSSPDSRRHELSFKQSHAIVNANVAQDKATVLVCSAFIESDYEALPTDRNAENALLSQIDYYPINAPMVMLPMDLNDETMRIGSQAVTAAAKRHQRFLVIAAPTSFKTVNWLVNYSSGDFTSQVIGEFDQIVVVEFRPAAGNG